MKMEKNNPPWPHKLWEKTNKMSSAAKTRNSVRQFQYKRCIEAALFISGSPISVEMLSQRLRDIPYDQIEGLIFELIRDQE